MNNMTPHHINKVFACIAVAAAASLMPNRVLAEYELVDLNGTYQSTFYDLTGTNNYIRGFDAKILDGAANFSFTWAWDGPSDDVIAGVALDNLASHNYGWTKYGYNCGEAYNQYNPNDPSAQPFVMFYGWANKNNPVEYYVEVVNPPPSIAKVSPGTLTAYGYYRGTYTTTENNQSVSYDFYDIPQNDYTFWGYKGPFEQYHVYRRPSAEIGTSYSIDLNAIFTKMNDFGMTRIGSPSDMANQRFCTETYGDSISGIVNASFWLD